MLLDARQIFDQDILSTDVCIIGAGPAGIAIARELNGQGFNVLLLESGGFEYDPKVKELASGTYEGDPYCPQILCELFSMGAQQTVGVLTWPMLVREKTVWVFGMFLLIQLILKNGSGFLTADGPSPGKI